MILLKKVLSIFIVITLFLTSVSQGLFVFAEDEPDFNAIEIFAENLTQMIRENNVDDSSVNSVMEEFYNSPYYMYDDSVLDSSLYLDMADDAFQTCRLIVKSKELIDFKNAIDCVNGYNDLYVLQYGSELEAKLAYEYYIECDYVEYVEPDLIVEATVDDIPGEYLPDDDANIYDEVTAEAIEWLSDKIGFSDIKDELAERIKDDYILVAVIDSGVDTDHELLVDRLVESNVNFSSSGERNSVEDDYGHGTHVAGIVANNTLSNVKIKPYKVLNDEGKGSLSAIATAIDMAVQDGADVINLSLAADGESQVMTDAVNNAVANDVNVVVAAGNKGVDLDKKYVSPACIESAITVSATDKNDKLASFSNYDGTIDIAAPGTDIESSYLNNKYLSLSGTSMAAPQVAAGLAIVQSFLLDEPAESCERIIKEYAILMQENEGSNHFGAGILYLKYLLEGRPTVADPVFSVDSCSFTDAFTVEISCPDKDADIYYLMYDANFSASSVFTGEKYTKPITVSSDTTISAIAYERGKIPSSIVTVEYDRVGETDEDYYSINSFGYITGYYGSETDVVVPDAIDGIVVNGIAISAFEGNSRISAVVLPDTCEKLNPKAFKDCTSLVSVYGAGIEEISINVFQNSSVELVDFPKLKTIGSYAFSGCSNLNTISIPFVESIGTNTFEQSGITSIDAPELISIGLNAFTDCYNLASVSAPKLEALSIGVFKNCISLKNVDMPDLKTIGAYAFRNTALEYFVGKSVTNLGHYAFADNEFLKFVDVSSVTSTGTNVFLNCKSLKIVGLLSLESVNDNTFSNCTSLLNLYLPNATSVNKSAFKNSSIEILKFEKITSIKGLPDTLQALVLPGTVSSISATTPKTDFIVYGYDDTYAEQYAANVNKRFLPVPALYDKTSDHVSADKTFILVYAIGFNCTYQWYRNDEISNEGGTPIEGAVNFFYVPSSDDNSEAYYCVVTSSDGTYVSTIKTDPIVNAPEYRDADYTEYDKLVEEIHSLDRNLYKDEHLEELDELLKTDVSGFKLSQQEELDQFVNELQIALELVKNSFIMGDITGDDRVSAIDVRYALKYVVGIQKFTNAQFKAADMDYDGEITAVDARLILEKAVEF